MENFDQLMASAIAAEKAANAFPLGPVLVVILVATLCIAALLVLAWFLFKTRLPRSFDGARGRRAGGSDRGG